MNLDPLIEKMHELNKPLPIERWATVTQVSPLRVRPDTESALTITPINLVGTLAVNDRVRIKYYNNQLFVTHRLNGPALDTLALSGLFVAGTAAYTPTAYRENNWVAIDGGWQMAASGALPAISYGTTTALLTLPTGWRPSKLCVFPSYPFGSAALITAGVRVQTSGVIEVHTNNIHASGTTGGVFSLACRFRI